MKEKGMNKLIELLNEKEGDTFVSIKWDEDHFKDDYFKNYERKIISKRYGFIKWLVDNDKIDLLKLDNRIALSEFNKVERVLMALSIQDNPIEFLISILK